MSHEFNAVIAAITEVGVNEATRLGFASVLERSDRSEAVYLHVRREATWFGFRIACHSPVHDCSRDYQQFLLPRDGDAAKQRELPKTFPSAVATEGIAVADPAEVRECIERAEMQRADGIIVRDRRGQLWTWNAEKCEWCSEAGVYGMAPQVTPRVKLSWRATCTIRHRLNHIARWSYEEFRQ